MRLRGVAMAETKAAAHCAGAHERAADIQFTASIFCISESSDESVPSLTMNLSSVYSG